MTEEELQALGILVDLCNRYEGLDVKINWDLLRAREGDATGDFLFFRNGILVAYASLDGIRRSFETTGVVHPDYRRRGIFRELFSAAVREARRRDAQQMLLVCERASASGQAFVASTGARYTTSEYRMVRDAAVEPPLAAGPIQLREAGAGDVDLLIHLQAHAFDESEEASRQYVLYDLAEADSRAYIALLDGTPIGKIGVVVEAQGAYLRAFGVLPEHRGRGYGRQILAATIRRMLDEGRPNLVLEVATDNRNALGLYQSCGFRETTVYDYFAVDLR
jgi:ribosomal protein S18 acetylase RimI-like enzyme